MTAIAGLWRWNERPPAEDCDRMLSALTLYGTDGRSHRQAGPIALGRTMMRLLPEDVFDRQPLLGNGGRLMLVADLRLDNRDDLIVALGIAPELARVAADSEILLRALERWNIGAVERLAGDFAFALWEVTEQRLLLVRDPIGQRPLFYHRNPHFLAFASMVKGLHVLPEILYEADEQRVIEELALMPDLGSRTFFKGIQRVEPGHVVTVTHARVENRRYWRPAPRRLVLRRPEEYYEALREGFDRAVACRLRGTGDVGAHLSGGLDSSSVTATAARLLAPTDRRVIAFTAVPREGYVGADPRGRFGNEAAHAAATAALYPNVAHVLVPTPPVSLLEGMDRHLMLYERPPFDLSNHRWGNAVYDTARQRRLSVLLTGNMGNMTISYNGRHLLPELLRSGQWLRLWHECAALRRADKRRWSGLAAQVIGPFMPVPLWNLMMRGRQLGGGGLGRYSALLPEIARDPALAAMARERQLDFSYRPSDKSVASRLRGIGRGDLGSSRKGTLAGWRLDCRDPTADVRLIELCLSIPTEQFLRGGVPAALLRGSFADRLPPKVLDERRKGRQGADWHEGLDLARAGLSDELRRQETCEAARRVVDVPRLKAALNGDWPKEGWHRLEAEGPYRYMLLRGVSNGFFLRRVADGKGSSVL